MSVSTFTGIQTSLRALLAQQRALDVTSHNVANASTVGYSRQEALLSASDPLTIAAGGATGAAAQLGTGVDVVAYQRVRDSFLDLQFRRQNMSLGDETARSDSLSQVELALAEPGENGIACALSKFWNAWSTLSNSAESAAAKQSLLDKSRTLAEVDQRAAGRRFSEARTEANDELAALTAPGGEVGADHERPQGHAERDPRRREDRRQAQRPLRSPRPAARQPLDARPGVGHRVARGRRRHRARRRDDHRLRRHDRRRRGAGRDVPAELRREPGRPARRADDARLGRRPARRLPERPQRDGRHAR